MIDNILETVKKAIGPSAIDEYFDDEIVMYINSTFSKLNQIGIGPEAGFRISSGTETWSEYYTDIRQDMIRDLVCKECRLKFDPPASQVLVSVIKDEIHELECRLSYLAD